MGGGAACSQESQDVTTITRLADSWQGCGQAIEEVGRAEAPRAQDRPTVTRIADSQQGCGQTMEEKEQKGTTAAAGYGPDTVAALGYSTTGKSARALGS